MAYLVDELANDAVPLPFFRVVDAVLFVRDQTDRVVEAHLVSDPLEQVNAEALEARVASQVGVLLHHHVRLLLPCHDDQGYVCCGRLVEGGGLRDVDTP